jgi:hypothetical protein
MSTAEFHPPLSHARPSRRCAHAPSHWERAILVLGVCLPVPALAATGLSLPLPAAVERVAAALVPWAETDPLGEQSTRGSRGKIIFAPNERRASTRAPGRQSAAPTTTAAGPAGGPATSHRPVRPAAVTAVAAGRSRPTGAAPVTVDQVRVPAPTASADPASTREAPAGEALPVRKQEPQTQPDAVKPAPPTSEPAPEAVVEPPTPLQDTVDDVVSAVQPVVDQTPTVVQQPVETVIGTVQNPGETVGTLLPKLGG